MNETTRGRSARIIELQDAIAALLPSERRRLVGDLEEETKAVPNAGMRPRGRP